MVNIADFSLHTLTPEIVITGQSGDSQERGQSGHPQIFKTVRKTVRTPTKKSQKSKSQDKGRAKTLGVPKNYIFEGTGEIPPLRIFDASRETWGRKLSVCRDIRTRVS